MRFVSCWLTFTQKDTLQITEIIYVHHTKLYLVITSHYGLQVIGPLAVLL